ncbi:MAG: hypothetical protein ABI859_15315 [Pseudomonadota bacterium]
MTDEELMAYVDGELDAAAAARAEATIAADATLAARMASQQELRARLQRAFNPVLEEPMPQRLSALLGTQTAAVTSLGAARERRDERVRSRWSWRELSAVAATLVLGVLLGPYVMRASQPLPFMSDGGRVVAIGTLQMALMSQLSGATSPEPDGPTIGMTFRTAAGQACRTFAMNPGPAGLACRERGDWVVEVLARNPRPRNGSAPDGYRQAGTPFPEAIRQAVEARIDGDPLNNAAETELAARNWRRTPVLKDSGP